MLRQALSCRCQTDSMLTLQSTSNGIRIPMPTLPSAGIGPVSCFYPISRYSLSRRCQTDSMLPLPSTTIDRVANANFAIGWHWVSQLFLSNFPIQFKSPMPNWLHAAIAIDNHWSGSRCQLCHRLIWHRYPIVFRYLQKFWSPNIPGLT